MRFELSSRTKQRQIAAMEEVIFQTLKKMDDDPEDPECDEPLRERASILAHRVYKAVLEPTSNASY
jgi:hypothetical protein